MLIGKTYTVPMPNGSTLLAQEHQVRRSGSGLDDKALVAKMRRGIADSATPVEHMAAGWQKLVMVVLMWLGRLEFFAVVALMLPRFWKP